MSWKDHIDITPFYLGRYWLLILALGGLAIAATRFNLVANYYIWGSDLPRCVLWAGFVMVALGMAGYVYVLATNGDTIVHMHKSWEIRTVIHNCKSYPSVVVKSYGHMMNTCRLDNTEFRSRKPLQVEETGGIIYVNGKPLSEGLPEGVSKVEL